MEYECHVDASKTGVTAEGLKQASKKNQLSLEEARKILGVDSSASWDEIVEKYHKMFEANEKNGSFYLQSKIYRAHERIKDEFESSHDESRKEDNGDTQSM